MEKKKKYRTWTKADNYQLLRFMNTADKETGAKNAAQVFGVSRNAIWSKYGRLTGKYKGNMRIVKTSPIESKTIKKAPVRYMSNFMVLDIKKVDIDLNKGKIRIMY